MQHLCPLRAHKPHTTWRFAQFGLFSHPNTRHLEKVKQNKAMWKSLLLFSFIHSTHKKIPWGNSRLPPNSHTSCHKGGLMSRALSLVPPHPPYASQPTRCPSRSTGLDLPMVWSSEHRSSLLSPTSRLNTPSVSHSLSLRTGWSSSTNHSRAILSCWAQKSSATWGETSTAPKSPRQIQNTRCVNTRAPLHSTQGFSALVWVETRTWTSPLGWDISWPPCQHWNRNENLRLLWATHAVIPATLGLCLRHLHLPLILGNNFLNTYTELQGKAPNNDFVTLFLNAAWNR